MNNEISVLKATAEKPQKLILGLMSGTSVDGLDLALCRIEGSGRATGVQLLEFATVAYPNELKAQLQEVVSVPTCSLQDLCLLHSYFGDYTADIILDTLEAWGRAPSEIDCIASHGQTVYHAPRSKHGFSGFPNATLQIGDGDHIAHRTGILTISDFRQKHTAAGGEGAPMAALIDRMVFGNPDRDRLLLNIGGIANFTYVPSGSAGSITADTGPGNTLLDAAARKFLDQSYDEDGATARKGTINQPLLKQLKADAFFDLDFPKTTGPELFNWDYVRAAQQETDTTGLADNDLLATLTAFSAETIAEAVQEVHTEGALEILVSGGGLHNNFLMDRLKQKLTKASFLSFEDQYFNPDAKEAVCFAVLANERLSGAGFSVDGSNQQPKINFGKISLPD